MIRSVFLIWLLFSRLHSAMASLPEVTKQKVMHPAVPHDTEVTKQKSYASSYSTWHECGKVHPLSINKVPLFDTIATPIYVESTAKLRMMFCIIAIVFSEHQRLERVYRYQFYPKYCIYYSYYSICSTLCKIDILSATLEHHYAIPQGVATPSLRSPDLGYSII